MVDKHSKISNKSAFSGCLKRLRPRFCCSQLVREHEAHSFVVAILGNTKNGAPEGHTIYKMKVIGPLCVDLLISRGSNSNTINSGGSNSNTINLINQGGGLVWKSFFLNLAGGGSKNAEPPSPSCITTTTHPPPPIHHHHATPPHTHLAGHTKASLRLASAYCQIRHDKKRQKW